ncbi:MAG: retropepsin-like aspartic protease, partial [Planctomycetota bacterium]
MKLRTSALASLGLIASCVVMKPIMPPPDLDPVPMSGPAGSGRTLVDAEAPPHVELTRGGTAWLVRPVINGTDVGWFVLDAGVTGMLISSAAVEQAGLTAIGTTRLADGSVTTVFLGETFQIGPLTVHDTKYAGADFPQSHVTFGQPVDGSCAYDLFAQAVLELDIGHERIGIYDPATYTLDEGQWQPLILDHYLPHVWCRFADGHGGLFLLDAGYPGAVQLFQHVVQQHQLLEGRRTRLRTIPTFGAQAFVRQGPLEWFEIGSQRLEQVETHFATGPTPLYPGSSLTSGIVGADVLR